MGQAVVRGGGLETADAQRCSLRVDAQPSRGQPGPPSPIGLMQHLLAQYQFRDCALKAVGVGSIGTRCVVSPFVGPHPDDILVLQGKQAEPSVLAPYVNLPTPEHQGQRLVEGQRLLQTASDAFLGWATNPAGDHI